MAPLRPPGRPPRRAARPSAPSLAGSGSPRPVLLDGTWTIPAEKQRRPLDGVVRALLGVPWSEARRLIETGKIRVAGEVRTDPSRSVRGGERLSLHLRAPKPRTAQVQALAEDLIVYADPSLVVVRKPPGLSTVPYGDESPGLRGRTSRQAEPYGEEPLTLDALVREVLARCDRIRGRAPLGVVQRLDKSTSGLIVFARTFAAKKHLAQQLRRHTMQRRYLALAHGNVQGRIIRSYLIANRGDGLRGSVSEGRREGQLAVTHIEPLEQLRETTLLSCRLETGRTHQIRIHLAEAGHPLLGESVYIRDFRGTLIPAPRLMLHAAELGFEHPEGGRPLLFTEPPPADFEETLSRLRARA